MRSLKILLLILLVSVGVLGLGGFLLKPEPSLPDLRAGLGPFFDRGYDFSPRFRSVEKRSLFITLSDGTRLAADIFLPTDPVDPAGEFSGSAPRSADRFPTILEYSPYNRAFAQPGMSWRERFFLWWRFDLEEAIYDRSMNPSVRGMIALGYAYASVDMRGSGASFGTQMPLMPQLGADGAEVVAWIATQEWSDGNVGMRGQSYLGWSQFATASHRPEALRCIAPALITFDTYTEGVRPGGIMASRWLREYSSYLQSYNLNRFDLGDGYLPAAPVVDEDGDGRILDEVPSANGGDPTLFTDTELPIYADGQERERDLFFSATMDHRDNLLVARFMEDDARFFDASFVFGTDTLTLTDTNPGAMLSGVIDGQIPVFNIGGWFDGFVRGTTKLYASMEGRTPARLLVGPRFHIPMDVTPSYKDLFGYQGDLAAEIAAEEVRFFDWCLRGEENGIEEEAPVSIYVMNRGWRREEAWPLKDQEFASLFFAPEGRLMEEVGEPGVDSYAVDFRHRADFGTNAMNRWILMWSPDSVMDRSELDKRSLVYETAPLDEGVEVTGHPVVHLWVGSNQSDGDVFVYLSDVDEQGVARYVTEGQLRASFHRRADPSAQTRGKLEVRPDLPWHGYTSGSHDPEAFSGGRVVELDFDLMPTAWFFEAGHRIRVSIAGADLGNFELNPTLCPDEDPATCSETVLHIHRGPARPSRVEIPVISGRGGG